MYRLMHLSFLKFCVLKFPANIPYIPVFIWCLIVLNMAQVNAYYRKKTRPCRFSTLVSERQSIVGETSGVRNFRKAVEDIKRSMDRKPKDSSGKMEIEIESADSNDWRNQFKRVNIKEDRSSASLWYKRRDDVLKWIDRLRIHDADTTVSKPQPSIYLTRKNEKG